MNSFVKMSLDMFSMLRKFMNAPAVTGFQEQRRKIIIEEYSKYFDSVTVDVMRARRNRAVCNFLVNHRGVDAVVGIVSP